MSSKEAAHYGSVAVHEACRRYGLSVESAEYYDAVSEGNGKKYEVKACARELDSGTTGRFRFWREEHNDLADRRGMYVIAVYDLTRADELQADHPDADPEAEVFAEAIEGMKKISPATVKAASTEWYNSGHADKGDQTKTPWPELFRNGL